MYLTGLGVQDHIPAQNQAGADLAQVVADRQAAEHNHTFTFDYKAALSARARKIGQDFYNLTRQIGGSRALKGGDEIMALANQIAGDIDQAPASAVEMIAAPVVPSMPAPLPPPPPTSDFQVTPVADSGTGVRATPATVVVVPQPAVYPTGIATPTLIPQPDGTSQYVPPETGQPAADNSGLLMVGGGLLLLLLLGNRGNRG